MDISFGIMWYFLRARDDNFFHYPLQVNKFEVGRYRVEDKLAEFHLPKTCMVATQLELSFDAKFMQSSFKNVEKVKENAIVIVIRDNEHGEVLRDFLYNVDHTIGGHSVDIICNAANKPKLFNEMRQERAVEIWASSLNIDPWDMQVLNVKVRKNFSSKSVSI